MSKSRLALLLAVAALTVAVPALAQTRIHRTLQVEDGLVQSQVNAILEDSRGFVWFGTFGGVSRWDGREFRNFQIQDGLAALDIRALHETRDGAILAGTAGNGISIIRGDDLTTFSTPEGLPGNSVRTFDPLDDGSLRVATSAGIALFPDESLDPATMKILMPGRSVSDFATCRDGGFYAATYGEGVFRYVDGTAEPLDTQNVLPSLIIRAIHELPDGSLLVSVYKGGLWLRENGRFRRHPRDADLAGHDVKAIIPARDGTLYLPTLGGGIAVMDSDGGFDIIDRTAGLPDDTSWAVHEGPSGVVYLGTWNGVSLHRPGRFTTWNATAGLPEEIVASATESPTGTFYIGTVGGGLVEITDRIRRVHTTAEGLAHDRVWSLLQARDGTLYIGTHAGVNTLKDGQLRTIYRETEAPRGRVYAMHEARDGTIYLATYGGIFTCRDEVVEPLYEEADLERSSVYAICEGRDGERIFGTGRGIVVHRDGTIETPAGPPLLAAAKVWSIHQGADGAVYFGTNGSGLLIMRDGFAPGGTLEVLDTTNGLSDNTVYGILDNGDGRLYLTTTHGVNVVDLAGDEPTVRHLGHGDGLAGEECSQGVPFRDSRGRLWFSTNRGASCYDPAHDLPNTRPPGIQVTRVRLYEDDLPVADFAGLPDFAHTDNYFKFEFIGTNPPAPEAVVYRYRLSRIDRAWVEARQNLVQYTALPHGDYTFEVKARNGWGYWSEPASLRFSIRPPYWQTWWFIALVVLAVGGTITLLVLNRVRHLLALEKLRTKIAADLHDDIGAGLTEISIMSEVIARKLPDEERKRVAAELGNISTASRHLVHGMSDIVWLVNPRRDSLHDLIARLGDAYKEVLRSSNIVLKTSNVESLKNIRLGMERRQHVFLIFKEAIHNAIKYSGCVAMTLEVEVKGGRMEIRLADDGQGFDPERSATGNGLANMRRRAEKLGAKLEIDSEKGRGTVVGLVLRA